MSAITALRDHYRDRLVDTPTEAVTLVDVQRVASLLVDAAIEARAAGALVQTVMTDDGVGVASRTWEGVSRIVDLTSVLEVIRSGDLSAWEALHRLDGALRIDVEEVVDLTASPRRTAAWALGRLMGVQFHDIFDREDAR